MPGWLIGRHQAGQQAWGEAAGKAEGQQAGQCHRLSFDEGVAHPGDTEDRDDTMRRLETAFPTDWQRKVAMPMPVAQSPR